MFGLVRIFLEITFTLWHKIIFPLCLNGISLHQLKSRLLHYLLSTGLRALALGRLDFEGGSGGFIVHKISSDSIHLCFGGIYLKWFMVSSWLVAQ